MDKYSKLKPPLPTPEFEVCKCIGRPPVVLQYSLSYNPISCADCNLEVGLNQLIFTLELVEAIADWRDFYFCFFKLWLDSGEYEEWAKNQLLKPDSPVNKRGLVLKDKIGLSIECFYWWFDDISLVGTKQITKCPNCQGNLTKRENKFNVNTNCCKSCRIIIAF